MSKLLCSVCFCNKIVSQDLNRFGRGHLNQIPRMANLPPRKTSVSSKTCKQNSSPLQILLQIGFPKHRALKALAATGNRSVQLASDWLLTHVNDTTLDDDEPREYIFYATPTGSLLEKLLDFWEKSKDLFGWNGAHSYPPHVTLVSFFKAPNESSLQLAKAVKRTVECVGEPPSSPLKLEPYLSHNFMGFFVSEDHANYLKKIAVRYVKEVSSELGVAVDTYSNEQLNALGTCFPWCTMPQQKSAKSVNLEAHVKCLHITLAYHFNVAAYDGLKSLVDEIQPLEAADSKWELRLYSRDPRFANHQVYKVTQGYSPKACDELELVLGDYVYIEEKEFESSSDGWVHGTSWLTGVSGFLPAVYTERTAESDAWTLHRVVALGNSAEYKSESDSTTDGEMAATTYAHEDAEDLGQEKSEESYKEWGKYWSYLSAHENQGVLDVVHGTKMDWKLDQAESECKDKCKEAKSNGEEEAPAPRWFFALRHGERVDLTYGVWVPHCFDESGAYVRKDLNMPLTLPERTGGKEAHGTDTPLTRVGRLQAQLVGEGLRLAGVIVKHVYSSPALRCVETAHEFLQGLQADPSIKIRVEPALFEYKMWHVNRKVVFMTPRELHAAGYNVDLDYKPYVESIDIDKSETPDEFYKRNELVMHSAANDTEKEGGNVIYVGHAATLDLMFKALSRLGEEDCSKPYQYTFNSNMQRVPYCALGAVRSGGGGAGGGGWQPTAPPCPPSINTSSGRFNWRVLV